MVLKTMWTYKSKSFLLYIFFFGDPNNPFVAYFVNNIGWEQEGITAANSMWSRFPKFLFPSESFHVVAVVVA